jgi:hypothetical protein
MTLTANFEFPPSRDYHIDVSRYEIYCTKKLLSIQQNVQSVKYSTELDLCLMVHIRTSESLLKKSDAY